MTRSTAKLAVRFCLLVAALAAIQLGAVPSDLSAQTLSDLQGRRDEIKERWERAKKELEEKRKREEDRKKQEDEEERASSERDAQAPGPAFVKVKTFYEGTITYRRHRSGFYVRTGSKALERMKNGIRFSNEYFPRFRETVEIRKLRAAIGVSIRENPGPREVWEAARHILQWLDENGDHDADAYDDLMEDSWPKVERIAEYYVRHRRLPWSACFSVAHLHFQLFRVCNLPPDSFGIATARYSKAGLPAPSHVYLGLRVGGRWYYVDPGMPMPEYEKRASVGRTIGAPPGMDYVHPFAFKTVADNPFKAIPLLGVVELDRETITPDITPLAPSRRELRRRQ